MARTIYALLVGINRYPASMTSLYGCIHDAEEFAKYLGDRVAADEGCCLELLTLTDEKATRQAIIDGFGKHLVRAGPDDVALFYFSGHGSQQATAEAFWGVEPDRMDETLVCADSRINGHHDLADKELSKLIAAVALRCPHVVVVLDCCHSGGGTRDRQEVGIRRAPTDPRPRPLDSYLVTPAEVPASTRGSGNESANWVDLPPGRHIVISACHSDEKAKEMTLGGRIRGVLSYHLVEALKRSGGALTYRDLGKRVVALVRNQVAEQWPLVEANVLQDLDQPFLGRAFGGRKADFTASYDKDVGWVIDGGAIHGIPAAEGEQQARLALFEVGPGPARPKDLKAAVGFADVMAVEPHRSLIRIAMTSGAPDPQLTYRAVVVDLPLPRAGVLIEGDEPGADLVRRSLEASGPGRRPSLLVRPVEDIGQARLRVRAEGDRFLISRAADVQPLVGEVVGCDEAAAQSVVDRLEHISRWDTVKRLENPPSRLQGAAGMEIYRAVGGPRSRTPGSEVYELCPDGSGVRLAYEKRLGKWRPPRIKVKLINTSGERLYFALLLLSPRFKIDAGVIPGAGAWVEPGADKFLWANGGQPIGFEVPEELLERGLTEVQDLIKLIVSTNEWDATLLAQEELDLPPPRSEGRAGVPRTTLGRLARRVQRRDARYGPDLDDEYADWTTSEVTITTVRPLDAVVVPKAGDPVMLEAGVRIEPHPGLTAKARLTTLPQAARDLEECLLPALLRDDPGIIQPFEFTASRGGEPGLSVLELLDVEGWEAVIPDRPLVLTLDAAAGRGGAPDQGDHLLPVGYDGEFFLPLGYARRVGEQLRIELEYLPQPVVGARSLLGSIRILFRKVVGQRLGLAYPYPLLAVAEPDGDGGVSPRTDPEEVRHAVEGARRILLYIHGIIGDTRGMTASAWRRATSDGAAVPALADHYDLILTFDYENLNTSIEENARELKLKLEAAGLGAGHGKTLHVAAHSMGGLVARWMIEREGGDTLVQRLVLLGTPNAGSPWPTVQDFAFGTLALGLNLLVATPWTPTVVDALMGGLDEARITLEQMTPGSPILKDLARGPGPGIPYVILAGDTALIPAALRPSDGGGPSILERLLGRIRWRKAFHALAAPAFFGHRNDIAVSVESIKSVPAGRDHQPTLRDVACDHLNYFQTRDGLWALAEALGVAPTSGCPN